MTVDFTARKSGINGLYQNRIYPFLFSVLLLVLVSAANLRAESSISVGAGAFKAANEYKGSSGKIYPIPFVAYDNDWISANTTRVAFHIPLAEAFWMDAIAVIRFQGFDQNLSEYTQGMATRKSSLDAGFSLNYLSSSLGMFSFEATHDLSDIHKGHEISLKYLYEWSAGQLTINPTVFITQQSRNLVHYYYGIRDDETRSWRAAYKGDTAINYGTSLDLTYELTRHWLLFSSISVEKMGNAITNSSIVDKSLRWSSGLGLIYIF